MPNESRQRRVADRLHAASIRLLRRLRAEDRHSGVGPARLSALSVLVFGGPLSLGALAAAERVKPPTMSRIVAGLERDGLVERRPDPQDVRAIRLRATPRGRRVLEQGRARRVDRLAEELRRLSTEELRQIERAVELIARLGD
ncbi:MAG: MarR family transcriptional regulator [Actinobacteria bacterium]|nr:MarR family transcriptional regulator [Actinomycetota bacterium]